MYAGVVLKNSTMEFDKVYTYEIPEHLTDMVVPGSCVYVPFGAGNKEQKAYVMETYSEKLTDFDLKAILKVCEPFPMLKNDQIELVKYIQSKYFCTYGDAISLMIPPDTEAGKKRNSTAFLLNPEDAAILLNEGGFTSNNHVKVVRYLLEYGESLQDDIVTSCQVTKSVLRTLKNNEIIDFGQYKEMPESPEPEVDVEVSNEQRFELTLDQFAAINEILRGASNSEGMNEYLLFGVTGSGKTEVYLNIIEKYYLEGKGSILLVPEIALTPQMTGRLEARFGESVTVIHSRLTPSERNKRWHRVLSGKSKIVAGPRSAVFLPVDNLKLIIIDEEQEYTYKSEIHPKYHAYDIAKKRIEHCKGVLVSGSATPRIESYYRALSGESKLLVLPSRINSLNLPNVEIVNMSDELASGNRSVFSRRLMDLMNASLKNNEKIILFLNRRGYSSFYLCRDCGYIPGCPSCSVSFTFHKNTKSLVCHYCGNISRPPVECPRCGSKRIGGFGAGTQQIEELCKKIFPDKNIIRMDSDTTLGTNAHARLLKEFETKGDILIGTQMIAKGHDYPLVTTVGILSGDMGLGMSDFRASERTFSLLTQAAGRSGRGKVPGNVVIQAYNVDDYSLQYASKQDYPGFYKHEAEYRKRMSYPPFGHIGLVIITSPFEAKAKKAAETLRGIFLGLRERYQNGGDSLFAHDEIYDVSKAPICKVRDKYRYRILIRTQNRENLRRYFSKIFELKKEKNLFYSFDIDPYSVL